MTTSNKSDARPAVTTGGQVQQCDNPFRVIRPATTYAFTCLFAGGRIAVVHVQGATHQEKAHSAVIGSAFPRSRYRVEAGDLTNGSAEPFYFRVYCNDQIEEGSSK